MSLADQYPNRTTIRRVTIITSDPKTRRIEAMGRDRAVVQVAGGAMAATLRWPMEGEDWLIQDINGYWQLYGIYPDPTQGTQLTDIQPGDAIINSATGVVHVTGSIDITFPALTAGINYQTSLAVIDTDQVTPWAPVGWWRDGFNTVHLQGLWQAPINSTLPKTLFTLPYLSRPNTNHVFSVSATLTTGRIDIYATGDVVAVVGPTAAGNYFSLDGIQFLVGN